MKKTISILIYLLATLPLVAQCVHRNDIILNKQTKPVGGAKIYVCQQPAVNIPCVNPVPLFTDRTCSTPFTGPVITDAVGNFDMYAESQWVTLQVIYGSTTPIIYKDYGLFDIGQSVTKSFNEPLPATSDSGIYQVDFGGAAQLLLMTCDTDEGTVNVNFEIRPKTSSNQAGTPVLLTPLTCVTGGTSTGTFSVGQVPINSVVALIISGVSNSPGILHVHLSGIPQ